MSRAADECNWAAFFLPQASAAADLRVEANIKPKRTPLVARVSHAPPQGWCVRRLDDTRGLVVADLRCGVVGFIRRCVDVDQRVIREEAAAEAAVTSSGFVNYCRYYAPPANLVGLRGYVPAK